MAGDDIIDAEWEEVPTGGDAQPAQHVQGIANRQRQQPQRRESSPYRDPSFWHDAVGLFFRGLWRVGIVVLGFFMLVIVVVGLAGGFMDDTGAKNKTVRRLLLTSSRN